MLTAAEARVLNCIERDVLLTDLAALLAIPSLADRETPAQQWMAARLASLGLAVDVWPIDIPALSAHSAFSMEVPRTSALGVVGTLGGGDGPTLILNGHVDVVPVGDLAQWTVEPYAATLRDGAVFGRGACDMKGGLAAALAAIRALLAAQASLRGRVALHSVVAEEDGGAGTLATLQRGHRGDGAVSMEPTQLQLAPAHAGALTFRLHVTGRSAHACVREEGVSAIELFGAIHSALLALEADRNQRLRQSLFEEYRIPYALSIGTVSAGEWPSSVPDSLVCEGRLGVAPGEDPTAAQRELEAAVAHATERDPRLRDHPPRVEWWGGRFLPASTPLDADIVQATGTAIAEVTGRPARLVGMTYGADMRLLVNEEGIPTVLFGPGDVRHAHRPDEHVAIEDLLITARVLALTAMRFCA